MRNYRIIFCLLFCLLQVTTLYAQDWTVPFAYPSATGMVVSHTGSVVAIYTQALQGTRCKVLFYDAISREERGTMSLPSTLFMLRLSQSGDSMLSVDKDGVATLRSIHDTTGLYTMQLPSSSVLQDIRFLTGDTVLAVLWKPSAENLLLDLWNLNTRAIIRSDTLKENGSQGRRWLSKSGELLCYTYNDSLMALRTRRGQSNTIMAQQNMTHLSILAYSHDDSLLVLSSDSGITTARLGTSSLQILGQRQSTGISIAEFAPDNSAVIIESTVYGLNLRSPSVFVADEKLYTSSAYSGDVMHWKGSRHLWYALRRNDGCYNNVPSPERIGVYFRIFDPIAEDVVDEIPRGHGYRKIKSQHFSLNDSVFASTDDYNITCFWDAATGRYISEHYTITPAALSHNGRQYYAATKSLLSTYSTSSNALDWQLSYDALEEVPLVQPTPNGQYLVLSTSSRALLINRQLQQVERIVIHPMKDVSITRDNNILFRNGDTVKRCTIADGTIQTMMIVADTAFQRSAVSFSYDGSRMLYSYLLRKLRTDGEVGGLRFAVRVLNIGTGTSVYNDTNWYDVKSLSLSHNGKYLFYSTAASQATFMRDVYAYGVASIPSADTFCIVEGWSQKEGSTTTPELYLSPSRDSRRMGFRWSCNSTIGVKAVCDERIPTAVFEEKDVAIPQAASSFSPHPAGNDTRWCFSINEPHSSHAQLRLYSPQGTVVFSQPCTLREESQQCLLLHTASLPSGMYKAEIQYGVSLLQQSFIILH